MFIAVEGCVGSGKTTLARLLAAKRKSNIILEQFEGNPFLKQFYLNPSKYALETELAFVLIHYHQISHELHQIKDKEYISDFHISKDLLFAEMNLNNEDLIIFKNLYAALTRRLSEPDMVICLKCPDESILERIEQRGRRNENCIDPKYFIKLNQLYEEYFAKINLPKIEVDLNEYNLLGNSACITWLSDKIDEMLSF